MIECCFIGKTCVGLIGLNIEYSNQTVNYMRKLQQFAVCRLQGLRHTGGVWVSLLSAGFELLHIRSADVSGEGVW